VVQKKLAKLKRIGGLGEQIMWVGHIVHLVTEWIGL
jgi:hypothetical protein